MSACSVAILWAIVSGNYCHATVSVDSSRDNNCARGKSEFIARDKFLLDTIVLLFVCYHILSLLLFFKGFR